MSHQVEESGDYNIDTDSTLVPVLCLRPPSNSLKVHQGQLSPAVFLCTFMRSRVLGTH